MTVNPTIQTRPSGNVGGSMSATHPYSSNYGNVPMPPNQGYYSYIPQGGQASLAQNSAYSPSTTPTINSAYMSTANSAYATNAAYSTTNASVANIATNASVAPSGYVAPNMSAPRVPTGFNPAEFNNQAQSPVNVPVCTYSASTIPPPSNSFSSHNDVQPSPSATFSTQQNYSRPSNPIGPSNYLPSNVVHNYAAPHAQYPVQPEINSVPPSQPLQPSPAIVPSRPELKSPARSSNLPVVSESSHLNAIRDLITPPLETESVNSMDSTDKDPSSEVLQPKVIDVKSLVRKSLNGTTPLDQKWKEFMDAQDKESRKLSISVARCYPLKNRFPDVMPYDSNRVQLVSAKDDYINASYLKDICANSPVFLITQAPLPATFGDFWLMIWEQQVETLICLLPDSELKNHYQRKEWFLIERMINVTHIKNRTSKVVVHLQFTQWPASGIPQSPAPLLQFVSDVLSYHKQQRNLMRPVAVHCSAGIGRSGCFCLISALVNEMNNGHGPRDVAIVATVVSQQRKFLMQDKEQLKFCYDAVLYYAQDLLMKRGILTSRASFDDKLSLSGNTSSHVRHPSEDFILGSGGLAKLQSGMEKLGLSTSQQNPESATSSTEASVINNGTPEIGSGDVSTESSQLTDLVAAAELTEKTEDLTSIIEPPKDDKSNAEKTLPLIASLLDPSNFTLDSTNSPAKKKITKENFACSKGSLSTSSTDSADPLSMLDPLWSLKK
ncbi:tyrosine-protein phosphatase non-receptor type 23 [Caerostris extrusa]|uniref:Tyrosine-protein phosphatase non-receptor type 23 n=1 Tax=Caerostris extrusa TaxID=172846 RepID=A0AAV4XDV9_CAEEX|nr:tyrosine-protein phosphatase non-receptor type 23 [Caerostris extrusa]